MQNVYIKTYGCQMNVYDSERMAELMQANGYKTVEEIEGADIIIINTCNIREKASEKIYSELGRIRKYKEERKAKNVDTVIAVAGCVAQAEGDEMKKRAPVVDIVIGPESYHHLPDMISDIKRKTNKIQLDFTPNEKFDSLPKNRTAKGSSAFVTIQEGCDKFCTFCVVPYTRGKEYSRPMQDVISEVKNLTEQGVIEINLLGQNVDAYHGVDEGGNETKLSQLIKEVAKMPEVKRIRYTTSHPNNFTDDLIEIHGNEPKLMPYLHLPVQSGSNRILGLMNRKYSREQYFKIIEKLRKSRPDIMLSSDFIVAFPSETEQDFEDTLDLVEKVGFSQSYSFCYSARPGTPAALMELVPDDIAKKRLHKLQDVLRKQNIEFAQKFQGSIMPVLFEEKGIKEVGKIIGKSPYLHTVVVNLEGENKPENFIGKIFNVEIIHVKEGTLIGKMI